MKITEAALLANGWKRWTEHNGDEEIPFLEKEIREAITLRLKYATLYLLVDHCSCELPNIRSLEQLAQLEYLLADTVAASVDRLERVL